MMEQWNSLLDEHRGMMFISIVVLILGGGYFKPLASSLIEKLKAALKWPATKPKNAASIIQSAVVAAININEVGLAKKLMDLNLENEVKQ